MSDDEPTSEEHPRGWAGLRSRIPKLDREQRAELTGRIAEGAAGDVDFVIMMLLSSLLASLGLAADSTAVVIGAMLVAPLMGPLVAAGLALAQANIQLWWRSLGVSALGLGLGLVVSIVVGLFHTGFELSAEIEARSVPDITDLAVAFASGIAVAYANSRTKVMQSLAGVAIAAALVPPLAVVGIALSTGYLAISGAAAILLVTNLVAIVLGAAFAFRVLGVRVAKGDFASPVWARRATMLLVFAVVLLAAPLVINAIQKRREGLSKSLLYPLSARVREAVFRYAEEWPGVNVILQGRSSVGAVGAGEAEKRIPRIGVLVATDEPLPEHFRTELIDLIRRVRGDEARVSVWALRSGIETEGFEPVAPGGAVGDDESL